MKEVKRVTAAEVLQMHIAHNAWLKGITAQQQNFLVMAMEEYGSRCVVDELEKDEATIWGTTGGLTIEDAKNWLSDDSEGNRKLSYDFDYAAGLLHEYFIAATKTVQKERERLQAHKHPEDYCHLCGADNPSWSCDNELFNRVNGSPDGILCPSCFSYLAKQKGILIEFRATRPDPHEVSKVKCDVCEHEWIAVRPEGVEKLECPNCGQVGNFENIQQ